MMLRRLTALLLYPIFLTVTGDSMRSSYRAAVYEHVIIFPTPSPKPVSRSQALKDMYKNLDVYKVQADLARRQKADIIVFPEDGIYGMLLSRDGLYPYLESIPDPEKVTWSPCADPTRFPASEVQHRLSCLATENKMYIAANMGDKIACDKREDPKCPPDGRYQYNTAVVYDPKGTLVTKYHKQHLFYESQFDQPEVETRFFDTPFGRFGLVVCFDLLFRDPVVSMVMHDNVTDILFPTAWRDALPLLSAVGYHSSFARGLGVNLLAANVHFPLLQFHGSGVYTPGGMASFYYNNHLLSSGKLLVTEIDILKEPTVRSRKSERFVSEAGLVPSNVYEGALNKDDEFFADVFHDKFKFRALRETSGEIRVCHGEVCCYLKYEMKKGNGYHRLFGDLFVFGVFDGLHTYQGQYYLQVCTLLKCASRFFKSRCGATTYDSLTIFKSLYIQGEFQTGHVYPQVVLSNDGQLELASADQWDFFSPGYKDDGRDQQKFAISSSSPGFQKPLLSASLLGRVYNKDNNSIAIDKDMCDGGLQCGHEERGVWSMVFDTLSSWYNSILDRLFPVHFK